MGPAQWLSHGMVENPLLLLARFEIDLKALSSYQEEQYSVELLC